MVNTSIAVFIAAFCVAGYFLFVKNDALRAALDGADNTAITKTVEAANDVTKTIAQVDELKDSMKETNALLSSFPFAKLFDFSIVVPEEAIGRPNPFTPTEWKIKALAKEKATGKK